MILKGVNSKGPLMRGLVSLDSKEGELRDLYHWWWITLLIVIYPISPRACKDGVNSKFILDNIVSTQTLHWVKTSKPHTIILKLNFQRHTTKLRGFFFFICKAKEGDKWVVLLDWLSCSSKMPLPWSLLMGVPKRVSTSNAGSANVAHWCLDCFLFLERCYTRN